MSLQAPSGDKAHRFKCPGCGGDQAFEPKDGFLTCQYCGRKEQIPSSQEQIQKFNFTEYLKERPTAAPDKEMQVKCESCGATVSFTPPQVAGECAFCGTKIVTQGKSADPLVAPEAVLPFKITQTQAAESVRTWLSSLWFAPNDLKKFAQQDTLQGVYLPFWSYDSYTISHYTGERGRHYMVTENYTEKDANGNTVQRTRQVQRTDWTPTQGTVQRWFDDVLVPATESLMENRLQSLEPWDLPALVPYKPEYLSGYKAQRYQVGVEPGFAKAQTRMKGAIDHDVRHDIGGDEQRVHNVNTAYSSITFKHILLPLWIGSYRFNGKVYQLMVNARTGDVKGDRPYSIWKILALVVVILAIILAIVLAQQGTPAPNNNSSPAPHQTGGYHQLYRISYRGPLLARS